MDWKNQQQDIKLKNFACFNNFYYICILNLRYAET